jgi:hypothetical protein
MNFFEQTKQKIDISKLDSVMVFECPHILMEYDTEKKKLHRVITLKEIIKVFGFDVSNKSLLIADIKQEYFSLWRV